MTMPPPHTQKEFCELGTHIEGKSCIKKKKKRKKKNSSASRMKKSHMPRHESVKRCDMFGTVIHLFIQQIFTEHLLCSRRDLRLEVQL